MEPAPPCVEDEDADLLAEGLAPARVDGAHGLDLRLEVGHDNVLDVRLRRDVVAPGWL